MFNGLLLSQAGAVAHALDRMGGEYSIYYSGGNGLALHGHLALGGRYEAELVLDGLQVLGGVEAPDAEWESS